jgi:hypothetical protein
MSLAQWRLAQTIKQQILKSTKKTVMKNEIQVADYATDSDRSADKRIFESIQ